MRTGLAGLGLLVAAWGLSACKREPPPPPADAGVPPAAERAVPDAGAAPEQLEPAELAHPLAKLSRCGECAEGSTAPHCKLCRKGWRCVRSLLDPSWAAMEESRGYTVYRREACPGCDEERWAHAADVEVLAETQDSPARLDNLPEGTPLDLERHMAPSDGECPPADEAIDKAIASYFDDPALPGRAPKILSVRKHLPYARAEVSAGVEKGFVLLRYETEVCSGWQVEAFGFTGCPVGHPDFFPAELRHAR